MSKNFKNIDDLAKDLLFDFESNAPEEAWDFIAIDLKKKKKRTIVIFTRIAASIAILLSIGTAYYFYNNFQNNIISDNVVILKDDNKLSDEISEIIVDHSNKNSESIKNAINNLSDNQSGKPEKIESVINIDKTEVISSEQTISNKEQSTKKKSDFSIEESINNLSRKTEILLPLFVRNSNIKVDVVEFSLKSVYPRFDANNMTSSSDEKSLSVEDEKIINSNIDLLNKEDDSKPAWTFGGVVSPVYSFRNINHNNLSEAYEWGGGSLNELNEEAIIAFSGGIDVEYSNNRLSISSGLYYSQVGQQTNNFSVNSFFNYNSNPGVYASNSIGNIVIQQAVDGQYMSIALDDEGNYAPNMLDSDPVDINAKVSDNFEFIELPLIANYKIIDKKVDIGVLVGLSTSILVRSKTTISYLGQDLELDDYNNLRKVNYNSIFGFGMQYPFNNRMRIKLQPVFKYALNSLNEDFSVGYYPYSFAVYTGLSVDF